MTVCNRTVLCVNKRNAVANDHFVDAAHRLVARAILTERVAVVHHNDHRLHFTLRQQIVGNIVDLALPDPADFVFTAAVLEIKHGVAAVRLCFISGRRINKAVAPAPGQCGFIEVHTHRAVRHIL